MTPNPLLLVPGLALIGLALAETVSTAIRVDRRGGMVTRWVSSLMWRAFHGGGSERRSGPPSSAGITITLVIVLIWAVLALAGWFLVFASDPGAVTSATTGQPADIWARLYFASYTLSTLGLGDYVPSGAPWQVVAGIASGFGFGIATLVITYLSGVVGAVTAKRQLARVVWGLGHSPQEIIRRAWDGQRFQKIDEHLMTVVPMLQGVAEQHRAYPLISYFKASDRTQADVPAVAMLHDTLAILGSAEEDHGVPALVSAPAQAAIDSFLGALPGSDSDPEELDTPPWPDVTGLQEDGIPVRSLDEVEATDDALRRRQRLGAVMHHQGWGWRDLEETEGSSR